MTDEEKKIISSQPPPPTDEIDGEWGDDDETLVRDAPSLSDPPKVSIKSASSAPPAASPSVKPPIAAEPAKTAAAPIAEASPQHGEEDEEEDEEDEEQEGEEEDEQEAAEASAQPASAATRSSQDWIPEWAPFAVLGLLVIFSIIIGLGLMGGSDAKAGEEEPKADAPAAAAAKPVKPSGHP